MELTRRQFGAGSISALALAQIRCGSSNLVTTLDVVEIACTEAVPVVNAFSAQLGPATVAKLNAYLQGISNAAAQSITELGNTTDSQSQQYVKIAGYFAAVATIALPAGIAGEVAAVIGAVIAAVQLVLLAVNHTPAPTPTPAVKAKLTAYQAKAKALGTDAARIQDAMSRVAQVKKLTTK